MESLFLRGPRQTGMTTLLREAYRGQPWIDLLRSEEFRLYVARPELFRQELQARTTEDGIEVLPPRVCVDRLWVDDVI